MRKHYIIFGILKTKQRIVYILARNKMLGWVPLKIITSTLLVFADRKWGGGLRLCNSNYIPATSGITPALPKLALECRQFRMGPKDGSQCLRVNISFGLACFPRWNYYHGPLSPCCCIYRVIDNCHTHTTTKCGCTS